MSQLSDGDVAEALNMLRLVVQAFAEEAGTEPTLGEFLQILGWSVPTGSQRMGASPVPLPFKAKVTGNRPYRAKASDRVSGLNDKTFVEAAELQGFLVDRARGHRAGHVAGGTRRVCVAAASGRTAPVR